MDQLVQENIKEILTTVILVAGGILSGKVRFDNKDNDCLDELTNIQVKIIELLQHVNDLHANYQQQVEVLNKRIQDLQVIVFEQRLEINNMQSRSTDTDPQL